MVTQENLDDFLAEFENTYGQLAFVALSMPDYERLALNIAELRRYIEQQGEIIIYYEEALQPEQGQVNGTVVSETPVNQ